MEKHIFQEIVELFKAPWKNIPFQLYFAIIVLGFGGINIWMSIYEYFTIPCATIYSISQNLSGFFVAIIAASVIDLYTSLSFKNMLSLFILSLLIFGGSIFLYAICYNSTGRLGLVISVFGSLLSLCVWIVANASNEKWSDAGFYSKMRGNSETHGQTW